MEASRPAHSRGVRREGTGDRVPGEVDPHTASEAGTPEMRKRRDVNHKSKKRTRTFQEVSINSLLEVKRLPKTTCWKVLVEGMSKLSHQTCTVQSPHFTSFHPLVVGGHAASISVSGSEDLSEPANIYQVGPPGTWERIWVIPSTSAFDWLKTPPDSHDHHDPPLV